MLQYEATYQMQLLARKVHQMTFDQFFSCHMLVWFQVNNFRIRIGKKDLGHIMTHNDTVSFFNYMQLFCSL